MHFLKNTFMLLVVFSVLLDGFAAAEKNEEKNKVVTGKNKDIVVCAEPVITKEGMTVGFRIELTNPSYDNKLVLFAQNDYQYQFNVRLFDGNGVDISPMPTLMPADKQIQNKSDKPDDKYIVINPGTSHVWFLPVPKQIRIDKAKINNENNLQLIPNGKYMAEIKVTVPYFIQDNKGKGFPEKPDCKILKLNLPRIPIRIDSKLFNQDIEKIYQETTKQASLTLIVELSENFEKEPAIRVFIENTGNSDITILKEFKPLPVFFSFHLTKEDGTPISIPGGGKISFGSEPQHVILRPAEFVGVKINICDLDGKLSSGRYKLSVEYHNQYGSNCFKGILKSNTINFVYNNSGAKK